MSGLEKVKLSYGFAVVHPKWSVKIVDQYKNDEERQAAARRRWWREQLDIAKQAGLFALSFTCFFIALSLIGGIFS